MSALSVSRWLLLALCAGSEFFAQVADQPMRPGQPVPPDRGWPREFFDRTATLVLHQPQVDGWPHFTRIHARSAVALTPAKGEPAVYGALSMEAETRVDLDSKSVALSAFSVTDIRFPAAKDESHAQKLSAVTKSLLPTYPTSIALDRLLAYVDASQIAPRNTAVAVDPPPILVSTQPAVLVIIDGEPVPVDIENTQLKKVVNTNWDLFLDKEGRFYLRDDKAWLSAKALDAAWTPLTKMPKEFTKLPDTDQYSDVKQAAAAPRKPDTAKGQGFMAKSGAGDFYAGKDGNVYKRDQAGNWYRNSGSGSWEAVNRPTPAGVQRSGTQSAAAADAFSNAQGRPQLASGRDATQGLNRDATARSWGSYNSQRYQTATPRMGGGWSSRGGGRRR